MTNLEAVAIEVPQALQSFKEEKVHREPHGSAPVRIAAKERRRRVARRIVDLISLPAQLEHVRLVQVVAR